MPSTNPLDVTQAAPVDNTGGPGPTSPFTNTTTAATTTASITPAITPAPAVAQTQVANANLTKAEQPATGLVSNNVSALIDQNSPLMQRAAAKAAEQSNARGMLNSSMAVGDAQNAVIANATPIAQSDAASTNQFALTNANAANTNSQFNAGQTNTVGTSNTAAENNAANLKAQQDAQAALQTQQIGATATQNTQQQQSAAVQQANQLLQQAASTHDQQVAAIWSDPNMSGSAKEEAIRALNSNYLSFQQSYQALAGLTGVTQLLNFSAVNKPVPGSIQPIQPGSNAAMTNQTGSGPAGSTGGTNTSGPSAPITYAPNGSVTGITSSTPGYGFLNNAQLKAVNDPGLSAAQKYLIMYPDVAGYAAGPVAHWQQYGKKEGRVYPGQDPASVEGVNAN